MDDHMVLSGLTGALLVFALWSWQNARQRQRQIETLHEDVRELSRWLCDIDPNAFQIDQEFRQDVDQVLEKHLGLTEASYHRESLYFVGSDFLMTFEIRLQRDPLLRRKRRFDEEDGTITKERLKRKEEQFASLQTKAGIPENDHIDLMKYVRMRDDLAQ
jgi:hypothetical protein